MYLLIFIHALYFAVGGDHRGCVSMLVGGDHRGCVSMLVGGDHRGCVSMLVGFTTTCSSSAYHH